MLVDIKDKWFLVRNDEDWDAEIIIAKLENIIGKFSRHDYYFEARYCIGNSDNGTGIQTGWGGNRMGFIFMQYEHVLEFIKKHRILNEDFNTLNRLRQLIKGGQFNACYTDVRESECCCAFKQTWE